MVPWMIGDEWKKVTKGKVELRIYPGGVVGDERDMVRKMRIGQIHAAGISTEGLTEIVPDFSAFYVPLAFQDEQDINLVLNDMLPSLVPIVADSNTTAEPTEADCDTSDT